MRDTGQARVRLAVAADAHVVGEVVRAAYVGYVSRIGRQPGPMLDDYQQRVAAQQVWVLEDTARIVGVLVLEERSDGILLDNIAVSPGAQGKGYGRTLLEFAEAEALRRGYRTIELYTHVLMTENIGLYERIGYQETHRITEKGFERVYMTKRLQPGCG